jgi:hypothetical protein
MKYHVLTKGFFFALYLFDKFGETFRKSDYYAEIFMSIILMKIELKICQKLILYPEGRWSFDGKLLLFWNCLG